MRRDKGIWLAAAALTALLWCGCAGIIAEKKNDGGQTETVRLGTSGKWSSWDRNSTKKDESLFLLKKESTF
jgi:hypothetical protein